MSQRSERSLQRIIESVATADGAGVKLRRSLGRTQMARLDPFLMLDEFSSYDASDYIAGFPSHPHRGFETVTYMLDGQMLHEDHLGNRGDLRSGDVQWMTAGRGIVHSEMPQQESGRMRGFQLWINLPASEKLKPASYRDIPAAQIPHAQLAAGVRVKVIAGAAVAENGVVTQGPVAGLSTDPTCFDVQVDAGAVFRHDVPPDYSCCVYAFEGDVVIGAAALATQQLGVLSPGERVAITGGSGGARFLLLCGRPLNEPVVQYGPFVMNTTAEIEQAVRDYQLGKLTG